MELNRVQLSVINIQNVTLCTYAMHTKWKIICKMLDIVYSNIILTFSQHKISFKSWLLEVQSIDVCAYFLAYKH